MSDAELVTTLIQHLDSVRADLRAVRAGMTIAREYDVWDQRQSRPICPVGNLLEVVGGEVVALWDHARIEVLPSLETFGAAYPDRRLVLRESGDAAVLRALLLRKDGTRLGLNAADLAIICLVAAGKSNKEIAAEIGHTERAVKNRLTPIFKKLSVVDRTQLALKAIDMRLLPAYLDDKDN